MSPLLLFLVFPVIKIRCKITLVHGQYPILHLGLKIDFIKYLGLPPAIEVLEDSLGKHGWHHLRTGSETLGTVDQLFLLHVPTCSFNGYIHVFCYGCAYHVVLLLLFVDPQSRKAVEDYRPFTSLREPQDINLLAHLVLLEFDVIPPCFEKES